MDNNIFRFVKYLGHGGMGLVTLWEYRPPGGHQVRRLVLKISTRSKPGQQPGDPPVANTTALKREKTILTVGIGVYVSKTFKATVNYSGHC